MMSYGALANYYDQLMADMPYANWLDYVNHIWQQHGIEAKTIVDLGCGTGNIALPLAARGYQVTGIDLSSEMLAIAREKQEEHTANNAKLDIQWLEQDMATWTLPHQVDTVISFCDSINYLLEEDELAATFRHTYDGLKPGGLFIFDVHTHVTFKNYAQQQPFTINDEDMAYIWHCYFDEDRDEIEHELTIFAKILAGERDAYFQRIDEWHCQRAYDLQWMSETLRKTGFHTVECYADFTMKPADEETNRAFFVAKKFDIS